MATSPGGSSTAGAPRLVIDDLLAEYADIQQALSDPAVHADQAASRRLGRRYAELTPIVTASTELAATRMRRANSAPRTRRSRKKPSRCRPRSRTSSLGWPSCSHPVIRTTPRTCCCLLYTSD